MVGIGRENLPRFKKKYDNAIMNGDERFFFEGQWVLVAYAKYVIEYAESVEKRQN